VRSKAKLSLIFMWTITFITWFIILLFQISFGDPYISLSAWNISLWVVLLIGLGIIGYYSKDWRNLRLYIAICALYQLPFTLLYFVFGVVPLEISIEFISKIFFGTVAGMCGSNIHKLNIMEKRIEKDQKKRYSVKL